MGNPFIIYPAIDMRHGRVVRLRYGDPNQQTIFGDDPVAAGERWLKAGATWLHVVNLDGAFGEKSTANWKSLPKITALGARVQFGGGVRTLGDVDRALEAGVTRVVLGTAAVENPDLVSQAIGRFGPEHIAVGIDARAGEVKSRGWQTGTNLSPLTLAKQMAHRGVRTIIHTDIARDGVLAGVNAEKSAEIAQITGVEVIASGGVATLADIKRAQALGLGGVITGRAIYDGKIDLAQAIRVVSG